MNDQREKLKIYIRELQLGFDEAEVEEDLKHLSDEEVGYLIMMCEEVLDYQNVITEELKKVDPEGYEKAQNDYYEKLERLEDEYLDALEKLQEQKDEEMDKLEVEARRQLKQAEIDYQKKLEELQVEMQKDNN